MPGLDVRPAGRSEQISIVNGPISSQVTHLYEVRALRPGRYAIPIRAAGAAPVSVTVQVSLRRR